MIRGQTKEKIRKALKPYSGNKPDTWVPLVVKWLKKSPVKVGTYAFKARFQQRFPCRDREGNKDTRYEPLTDEQWIELALVLDCDGFQRAADSCRHQRAADRPEIHCPAATLGRLIARWM